MKSVRLIKVAVQPYAVLDDGETLQELQIQPAIVPAAEWEEYAKSGFEVALKELEQSVNAGD